MNDVAERTAVGFRSERGAVLVAVMAATSLVALDSTVLATAVPTIVADLGGFSQFPWLFSIYLLTSAVTTPLFGRLADSHGRRPVLLLASASSSPGPSSARQRPAWPSSSPAAPCRASA